jgi:hypothetical protein
VHKNAGKYLHDIDKPVDQNSSYPILRVQIPLTLSDKYLWLSSAIVTFIIKPNLSSTTTGAGRGKNRDLINEKDQK